MCTQALFSHAGSYFVMITVYTVHTVVIVHSNIMYVRMYVCIYVLCMYVCSYVFMYVCICKYVQV